MEIDFWDTACSLVEVDRRLRGTYCLRRQGINHRLLVEAVRSSEMRDMSL
jgi:hypothetical protein